MSAIIVTVTHHDIAAGTRGDCGLCPIALATKRAILAARPGTDPGALTIRVHPDVIQVYRQRQPSYAHLIDSVLYSWVRNFDAKVRVRPITFSLELP